MDQNKEEQQIPFFRSWNGWYSLVLFILIFEIVVFYFITLLLQ
jgi:hypothetical protein